ncbi:MAG: bifunctional alpha,alpha-trehalose-phosphate synthase (UDP-forming)/trehalose-phosphatase [Anaeromyxobacter sp.]
MVSRKGRTAASEVAGVLCQTPEVEMARLLIVSNRLPVTVTVRDGQVRVERSSGGLATGMQGPHERLGGVWIGWPGDLAALPPGARAEVDARLEELRLRPVELTADEVSRYYETYANGVLWPLLHYFAARLPLEVTDFDVYARVNEKFADAVAAEYRPGDLVWVHDYQLMLVPKLLRERIPDARIGFFLHIPFPSSEVFRLLPQREALLDGVLGADLVGFHTAGYLRHFASSALRLTSAPSDLDRIRWKHGDVHLGVFPMGIDAHHFSSRAGSDEVRALVEAHARDDVKLLVGVDRLDYTKGIPRRLLAFEALLRRHPELRGKVRLVQVAVPSRERVEAYREFREEVDALVGRIHGEFATPTWSPIHYLYRGLSGDEVIALYRAAHAVLVTPLRDGMNLVAKEFVAARPDGDGVLVLSEFAGAASELSEALRINPYDVERTADALVEALTMPEEARRARMAVMRERVTRYDVHAWARAFVERLESLTPLAQTLRPSPAREVRAAVARIRAASRLALLLDYDGTLVPFFPAPELAVPDAALLDLLRRLAARPGTEVHVVSGRKRTTLERWLGALPVGLHAEHGLWSRFRGEAWAGGDVGDVRWREPARAILEDFAGRTPGAQVEEKSVGFAWHWRAADPEYGAAQARELSVHLSALFTNAPVELLQGDRVVEIRPHGVDKGRAVRRVVERLEPGALCVGLGDDRTDEDLFAALPAGSEAVHVGPGESRAPLRLADTAAARAFLEALLP